MDILTTVSTNRSKHNIMSWPLFGIDVQPTAALLLKATAILQDLSTYGLRISWRLRAYEKSELSSTSWTEVGIVTTEAESLDFKF